MARERVAGTPRLQVERGGAAPPPAAPPLPAPLPPAADELAELRRLLLAPERRQLEALQQRLDAMGLTAADVAAQLPEAIALRGGQDRQLARALAPTIDDALGEAVRRNPRDIATAIFPVLGPAIRKAIAETMAELVSSINRALEHSFSVRGLQWRLESWRTGVPYAQVVMKHALVYRVEQAFLIHAETGLLLAHVSPPDLSVTDADLISGMMTAIRDFVGDSFGEAEKGAGGLRTFAVGELTVMVEQGPRALLAAVVRGQAPPALLRRLQDTLEAVHFQYALPLASFDGDTAPFEPAKPLLAECLETVLSTDRPREVGGRVAWLPWAVLAMLALVAFGWWRWREGQRFARAVAALEAEPGFALLRAERDGGRWQFAGLRDPLARDPRTVLAEAGADTAAVRDRWAPHLSFDPGLVAARARAVLAAPASVRLEVRGDTLVGGGAAPIPWLVRQRAQVVPPPGVQHVRLGAVEPLLPAALVPVAAEVAGERVLFALGSSALDGAAGTALDRVAARLRQLDRALEADGFVAEVRLTGRADTVGTEAANAELSRERADAVRRALGARGVGVTTLESVGLGTAEPLAAPTPAERARLNRSVSFTVRLVPDAAEEGSR
ncbi:MAG: OmpA family protein [Gemmatimonadales bacterium]|nr:OmpA family protein [Gemmatimonadales bacterium]